jgi:hypothetical protein
VDELVACVRCGAAEGVRLPAADATVVICAACEAEQPAGDYVSPMARIRRATSTNKVPKITVGIPEDLRHKVEERKAKRRLAFALGLGMVLVGIVVAVAMLAG